MRNNKGITLVALIITIVVLLILAVVAIGAVQESGIVGHAQNAATSYNEKQSEENTTLQNYTDILDKYGNGNLVKALNQIKEGDVWESVTLSSNISDRGVVLPNKVIAYNGSDSVEIPLDEVYYEFNVVSSENTYYRINYSVNRPLPTGEETNFLYIEQISSDNIVGVYFIVFESVGNYNTNVIYTYNLSNGQLEEHTGVINIQGTVNELEIEHEVEDRVYYTYSSPILDGLKNCFTGTVTYAQ